MKAGQEKQSSPKPSKMAASQRESEDSHSFIQKYQNLAARLDNAREFVEKVQAGRSSSRENIIHKFCGRFSRLPVEAEELITLLEKRIERMMKNKRIKKNWNEEDISILVWVVARYAQLNSIENVEHLDEDDWQRISGMIPGTTAQDCMFRVLGLKKVRLSDRKWSQKQSSLLSQIVAQRQSQPSRKKKADWREISQQLFRRNTDPNRIYRNAKQTKEHWTCYLNPSLRKGPWSLDQDTLLLQSIVDSGGVKKWAEIARIFEGRTENALKNRFSLVMAKYYPESTAACELQQIQQALANIQAAKQSQLLQGGGDQIVNVLPPMQFTNEMGAPSSLNLPKAGQIPEITCFSRSPIDSAQSLRNFNSGLSAFSVPSPNACPPTNLQGNQYFVFFSQFM